jgi:hypothetical protein
MTAEELIFAVLQDLAEGRVFPDIAEPDTPRPYITYQAAGGEPVNYLSGDHPEKQPVRMQVNCWADTRVEASALGAQVEDAMRAAVHLLPEVATGRIARYDEATSYRGTMQDFMIFC